MQPIRVTIHPKDVPAGYEAEAVFKMPVPKEHTMTKYGIPETLSEGGHYIYPRLVLTPKRPSLAQRVKDSGWRCPIWAEIITCMPSDRVSKTNWGVQTLSGFCTLLRPESALASVKITEEDYGMAVRIDDEGYPIVKEE